MSPLTKTSEQIDDNLAETKAYVDSFSEDKRNRRDVSIVFFDQDDIFDNMKITSINSNTVDKTSISDNEQANKKFIHDNIGNRTPVRLN